MLTGRIREEPDIYVEDGDVFSDIKGRGELVASVSMTPRMARKIANMLLDAASEAERRDGENVIRLREAEG